MKRFSLVALVILCVVTIISVAYAEFFTTVYVRTLLHVYGKAVIIDSARVQGNLLVNGNTTIVGTLTSSGAITLNDSVAVQQIVLGRGQNTSLYVLRGVKHGGTVVFWGDTLGNLFGEGKIVADDSLRSQGPFLVNSTSTLVGAVTVNDKLVVDDSVRSQGPLLVNGAGTIVGAFTASGKGVVTDSLRSQGPLLVNGAGTIVGAFTASGKGIVNDSLRSQGPFKSNGIATLNSTLVSGTAAIAVIDSFATTGPTKVSYMPGATLGDVFVVSEYLPSYSAVPDTGCKYGIGFQATDSVITTRTPTRADGAFKSGGLFTVVKIDK